MKLTIDAATLAKAAKLAAAIVEKRNYTPILGCVLIVADAGTVTLRTTDLDCEATIALPCNITETGSVAVAAAEFAGLIAKAAKAKGAQAEIALTDDKLAIISGRSRFTLQASAKHDEFPVFAAWEAAETWEGEAADNADIRAEGVTMGDLSTKKLAKVAKYVGATAAQFSRHDGDEGPDRYRVTCCANQPGKVFVTFEAKLAPPAFEYFYRPRRCAFEFDIDRGRFDEAQRYLRDLRASLGLPLVEGHEGALQYRDGVALGLTVGEGFHDYKESRAMADDWQPPAGTAIEEVPWIQDGERCTIDGVEYNRMHDGAPWHMRYVPEREGFRYPDGAYTLPMPTGQRRILSALVAEIDGGDTVPVGLNTSGKINLSAEQVAAMCGPIDPATFVDMTPLAFHHGRLLATGDAARRFNALQVEHVKRLRRIAKAPRTPERLERYAAECASFAPAIAALIEGADVIDASIAAAGGLPREEAPADEPSNVIPLPVGPLAGGWRPCAAVEAYSAPEPAEAEEDPAAEDEGEAMVQLLADCAPVMPAPAATGAMERRLARLEAALGLADAPKRTPAHAAAIRRGWRLRRAVRAANLVTDALESRVDCERARANAIQAQLNDDCRRVVAIEDAWKGERAELVAEIDRLRGLENTVLRLGVVRTRTARRGAALRRDLVRARAERDGIAANLQAMSRRVTADAALIDRLQPTADASRPRIILNAR